MLSYEEAFTKAKELLDKCYGDSFVISSALRDKLEGRPKVSSRDGKGLQKFGDFLYQCYIAMQSIGNLCVPNDDRENQKLLRKLPDWVVSRWGRLVAKYKQETSKLPLFEKFADFVSEEAKIACDSVTSLQSLHPLENHSF